MVPATMIIKCSESHEATSSVNVLLMLIKYRLTVYSYSTNFLIPPNSVRKQGNKIFFNVLFDIIQILHYYLDSREIPLEGVARNAKDLLVKALDERFFSRYQLCSIEKEEFLLEQVWKICIICNKLYITTYNYRFRLLFFIPY